MDDGIAVGAQQQDTKGSTAGHVAAQHGHGVVLDMLSEHGALFHTPDATVRPFHVVLKLAS